MHAKSVKRAIWTYSAGFAFSSFRESSALDGSRASCRISAGRLADANKAERGVFVTDEEFTARKESQ
jgi:hypothetical protein